jgi:hypothetical protein
LVEITGDPNITCEVTVGGAAPPTAGVPTATAMRIVDAVQPVVARSPVS